MDADRAASPDPPHPPDPIAAANRRRDSLASWLRGHYPDWRRLDELVARQHARAPAGMDEALELVRRTRALARDLSLARAVMPGGTVTGGLEALMLRAHETLFRRPENLRASLTELLRDQVPAVASGLRGPLAAVAGLFLAGAAAGWWLVRSHPPMASLFASLEMMERVEAGELWTEGITNVLPSSLISLDIMTNNVVVALSAFVLGSLYGLGTLYIIGLNGLTLGGVFALAAQHGLAGRLFAFVLPHGVVELGVICVAGAAGVRLGEAILRPGERSRAEAFRLAVAEASRLLPVLALLLAGAGLIEGYVSPDPRFSLAWRASIGLSYGLLMWLTLTGRFWRRRDRIPA